MIDTASTSESPPLWPCVGALLIAGWIGGLVASMLWTPLLGAHAVGGVFGSPRAVTAAWLAPMLAGALVASAILPRMLSALCDFELRLGAAFVVTLGRSLAGFAAATFLSSLIVARGTTVPSSAAFFVVPEIVSLAVGYQLLQRLARPVRALAAPDVSSIWAAPQPAAAQSAVTDWSRLLAGVRAEIGQLVAVLARADPMDVPARVGEAFTGLEALAERVEDADPPTASARTPQDALVAGIRRLQGALVDLSEAAWRGDHRRELSRLRGLDEIERALAQLESAGGP